MQIDAASLGVRYRAGFIARERERRAGYSNLTGNGESYDIATAAVEAAGVRVANEIRYPDYQELQLHPRDVGGAIVSLADRIDTLAGFFLVGWLMARNRGAR